MEKSHEIRLAHELAHSLVAIRQGEKVSRITLFILGGVAQITEEPKEALQEFRMAFVGPLSSLGLAVFNLLPGFPMDGGRIFRSILWKITGNLKKATRGYDQVLIKTAMPGMKARDLMTCEFETVSSDLPVQTLVDDYILKKKERVFLVMEGETIAGIICRTDVLRFLQLKSELGM